jgi:hypothetical protein
VREKPWISILPLHVPPSARNVRKIPINDYPTKSTGAPSVGVPEKNPAFSRSPFCNKTCKVPFIAFRVADIRQRVALPSLPQIDLT